MVDSLERGGLERLVTDLAVAQLRRGHRVAVFSINQTGGFMDELQSAGVPVIVVAGQVDLSVSSLRGMGIGGAWSAQAAAGSVAAAMAHPGPHLEAAAARAASSVGAACGGAGAPDDGTIGG